MDEDEALATDQDTSGDGDWSQLDADDDNILGDFLFTKTGQNVAAVSYTHLTLPTRRTV